jgi:sarcosine oxidase subunit beta
VFSIRDGASVAVVGAGIVGLTVAHRLVADRGLEVTLFDPRGYGAGATAIQPGGVRQQWASEVNCRLARESHAFYRDLAGNLGRPVDAAIQPGGYVFVASTPAGLADLERAHSVQRHVGVPSVLLSPAEIASLVPGLDADAVVGGAFCDEDGYFDRPQAVVAAVAEAAFDAGARLVRQRVIGVRPGGAWSVDLEDGAQHAADAVVVCAGADSAAVVGSLGLDLPIRREARHLFYSDPIRERLLEPLVVSVERHFAAKQLADGSVLASDLSASGDPSVHLSTWRGRIREEIATLLPMLEYVSFRVHVPGTYDLTPDRQMIVGPVEGLPGLVLAAGMSGRGFMMAPAVARLVADALAGAADSLPEAVALSRFEKQALAPESQVV